MKTVAFFTLGCKVNQCDTDILAQLFRNKGYEIVGFDEKADVYVINTCTVTAVSDKKSRQMLSRARRANPVAVICATGCYAQRAGDEILALPSVDVVVGITERANIVERIEEAKGQKASSPHITSEKLCSEEACIFRSEGRTRAFIKIQEGCNHFCSYCIVPHVRGRERSESMDHVLDEARKAADAGFKEIVLTGIQLSSYGKDIGKDQGLLQLAAQLSCIEGIQRIRFGSLEMDIFTKEFIGSLAALPKVCRHYHIPLQSGSDTVLQRMNRHYTTGDYAEKIELLKTMIPEVAITTDVMTGFPGETEEEFASTLQFAKRIRFNKMHVFPYSRREGTPAASMPGQIPRKVREERASNLIALGTGIETEWLTKLIGTGQQILVEESCNGEINGHTDRYVFVHVKGASPVNSFVNILVEGVTDGTVIGKMFP